MRRRGSVGRCGRALTALAMTVLAGMLLAACGRGGVQAANGTFTQAWGSWPPQGVVNPFAATGINGQGYTNTPLTYWLQKSKSFQPEAATSWHLQQAPNSASNATVTIHLRSGAKWSDGSAITSRDVKMSLELGYLLNYQETPYIASIDTPNQETVVVHQTNVPFNLFERDLLTSWVYPSSAWGRYVPSDVAQLYQQSLGGAQASSASSQITALVKKISAVDSRHFPQGGPFTYGQITSNEMVLDKNGNWWGASRIRMAHVDLLASSGNTQQYSYLLSGRVDFLNTYAPPNVVDPYLSKSGNHLVAPNGDYGPGLYFNTSVAPFNDVRVRQAFAYIINRTQTMDIAYPPATSSVGAAVTTTYPTGLPPASYGWLTSSTASQLNRYQPDQAKATQLLEAAGLRKTANGWEWQGTPLSLEVASPAPYTDWVAIGENVANQLTKFGIKTAAVTADANTYFTKAAAGDYTLSINSVGSTDLDPWAAYSSIMSTIGLSINVDGTISRAKTSYNWGPEVDVQGVGQVNVVKLWNQLLTSNDMATERKAVNDLALAINTQLPVIDLLYNKFYAAFYTTNRWKGWPASSSPLWDPNVPDGSMAILVIEQSDLEPAK